MRAQSPSRCESEGGCSDCDIGSQWLNRWYRLLGGPVRTFTRGTGSLQLTDFLAKIVVLPKDEDREGN